MLDISKNQGLSSVFAENSEDVAAQINWGVNGRKFDGDDADIGLQ
jgi:hypothetical protein